MEPSWNLWVPAGDHFGPFSSILVHFGAPHIMCNPMTPPWRQYPLSSVHLIQRKMIKDTPDKFKSVCSIMLWWTFWSILGIWSTSCATPWPLHEFYWLLNLFKCPCYPKKDDMSHSGQIAWSWYGDHFGPFWSILIYFGTFQCTSCATPWPLHELYWLLNLFKCPCYPKKMI